LRKRGRILKRRVTVKDLANELGLSLGTINMALNNKKGVSDKTRERVIAAANEMGYRVNRVAQGMARKPIDIGIIGRNYFEGYDDLVISGIERELHLLSDYNVAGSFSISSKIYYLEQTYADALREFKDEKDAIIMTPAFLVWPNNIIDMMMDVDIPLMFVGPNELAADRFSCVKGDSLMSGRLAGEYLTQTVERGKTVAIILVGKTIKDQYDRYSGFMEVITKSNFSFAGVYEAYEEPNIAYYLTKNILLEKPDLGGIYVTSANWLEVCRAIEESSPRASVRVVVTEANRHLHEKMEKGIVSACIYQNPAGQGSLAVRSVYESLAFNRDIFREQLVTPQLLLRSNLSVIDENRFFM